MLVWMKLKNLALVAAAEIEFAPGYNVISGETGAGKSVIMGGVSLLLGRRADKSAIRTGTEKCEIAGEFRVPGYAEKRLRAVLENAGLDWEDPAPSLLIRRVITPSSSRNYINSTPVALPVLKAIGELLIDVHAANENQSLLKPAEQLRTLDRFAGNAPLLAAVAAAWDALAAAKREQDEFLSAMPSAQEAERMRSEAAEIENAAPGENEDEQLAAKHAVAANSRSVVEIASRAAGGLTDSEECLFDHAAEIRRSLAELEKYDPVRAEQFLTSMSAITDAVSELSGALADYAADVELDEGEFQAMEDRMRVLQTLKRRYGPTLADAAAHLAAIRVKIDAFDNAEFQRNAFSVRIAELEKTFLARCAELTAAREKHLKELVRLLTAETVKLGFVRAEFQWEFESAEPGPNGKDRIQLLFSANPGVPPKPLKDVASSGEISRVMLAAKTVLAEADEIPVLIFDEIDANIGGETAVRVGNEIAELGKTKQVICISHLPQVARKAERHFLVSKSSDGQETRSSIEALDAAGRLEELARMLGGGKAAKEHAEALLNDSGDEA